MGAEFDAVNVATALHRVAKQKPDSQAELAEILSSAGFRHLVLMVEVQVDICCLVGLRHLLLVKQCLQHSAPSNAWRPLLPKACTTVCLASPKRGCSHRNSCLQADQCKPQQIANICWAFGTLGYRSAGSLMKVLCQQAELKISGFNPQNLANLWWALARQDHCKGPGTVDLPTLGHVCGWVWHQGHASSKAVESRSCARDSWWQCLTCLH